MTNEAHGRMTGQHDQKRQQAELPGCERPLGTVISIGSECSKRDVGIYIATWFKHADRIQIERFEVHP